MELVEPEDQVRFIGAMAINSYTEKKKFKLQKRLEDLENDCKIDFSKSKNLSK